MDKPDKKIQRRIVGFLWSYIRQDVRFLIGATICAAGVSGMYSLVILLLKPFADTMTHNQNAALDPQMLARISRISLAVVGLYAARWFFSYGDAIFFAEAGQRLSLRLRDAIYTHLQGMSMRYFNEQRTGALMSTINNDLPILQGSLSGLKDVATAPWQLVFGLLIIFKVSVPLSLVALITFPFMALTINYCTRIIRSLTMRTQDKLADVNSLLAESLGGIRVIQSFSAEKYEIGRFRRINQESKDLSMTGVRIGSKLKPTIDVIGAVGIAIALWVAGRLALGDAHLHVGPLAITEHRLTIGGLMTFIAALNQIAVGVGSLGGIKGTWESVMAAGERIWKNVLSIESDVRDAPDAIALPPVEGTVELRHVAFSYKLDVPVLCDISFTIQPGEVVALVGRTGAGKSTIADLIPRFYDPQAGAVLVDGLDIRGVTLESLRRQIGIVPQDTVLFNGTIRDNIAYGNQDATDEMIFAAARAANADEFIADPVKFPEGYHTKVGERGKSLSGGQKQRLAIARALLKDPRILILDEATSSMDTRTERLIQEALEKLMRGRTTLVIAHRLSTIVNADKILVLDAGRVVESGTHQELVRRPDGYYAQFYSTYAEAPPLLAVT